MVKLLGRLMHFGPLYKFPATQCNPEKYPLLNGSNLYRFTLPASVPVKQFWQLPIYFTKNRSFVQTDQGIAALSVRRRVSS